MNCERKDPLKLLWEWDLTFYTCIHPTFSNHCNWWLCNQSRDFFCDMTYVLVFTVPWIFQCKVNSIKQGTKWTPQEKLLTSHEVSGGCTGNKPTWHCSVTWLSFLSLIKGNLCGLLKQTDSIPLNNFISIQGFCSLALILHFYCPFLHINLKYFRYITPGILSPEYNK